MATIDRLPSGSYRIRIRKTINGKTVTKTFTGKDKRKIQHEAAMWEYAERQPTTLAEAVSDYIDLKAQSLSPSTIKAYRSNERTMQKDLKTIYYKIAEDITQREFQKAFDSLTQSPKTIKNIHGLISSSLANKDIKMPKVTLPKRIKPEYHIPTEAEVKDMFEAAKDTRLYIPLQLAVLGLRRGEICGLTLKDLNGTRLHVRHSLVSDEYGEYILKGTKTEASDRYIEIPDSLAAAARKQGCFCDMTPAQFSDAWRKFIIRNDFPHIRLHDMRHFFASYAHNILHLSAAQIQKLGGWETDYVMKQTYIQSMEDKRANDLVTAALQGFLGSDS